jgi:hypothetical protein
LWRARMWCYGPRLTLLKNMWGKQRLFETCHTWVRNLNDMWISSAIMQIMKLFTLRKVSSQLLNVQFQARVKMERGRKWPNSLLQLYTYYSRANPCLNLRL